MILRSRKAFPRAPRGERIGPVPTTPRRRRLVALTATVSMATLLFGVTTASAAGTHHQTGRLTVSTVSNPKPQFVSGGDPPGPAPRRGPRPRGRPPAPRPPPPPRGARR